MTPIETNKPLFFDTDGSPLEGGLIYIGQPSTDPRTNPKTVTFRDSGGSEFTAKQPLKTKAGRIVYNGLPIVSLVDGEYSMLIINANGQQVDYSRSVNAGGTSGGGIADFSEVTRVALTLSEVKAFDVSVGDLVENVGGSTATDNDGGRWLAVSATGGTADDETIIDFSNGLQGLTAKPRPYFRQEIVSLGGDFTPPNDQIKICRIGNVVTMSSVNLFLEHPLDSSPESADGVIPTWARPATTVKNVFGYSIGGAYIAACSILDNGDFGLTYMDNTFGTSNQSGTTGFTLSYVI